MGDDAYFGRNNAKEKRPVELIPSEGDETVAKTQRVEEPAEEKTEPMQEDPIMAPTNRAQSSVAPFPGRRAPTQYYQSTQDAPSNVWNGPVRRNRVDQGVFTSARRPRYPNVFRPYGHNTRDRVVGRRAYTFMTNEGYAAEVVESRPVPSLIPSTATLGQGGAPSVLHHVPSLQRGSGHWLLAS